MKTGHKYITKVLNNGKPRFCVRMKDFMGGYSRRFFENIEDAIKHKKDTLKRNSFTDAYMLANKFDIDFFFTLEPSKIEDIKVALRILPKNKTLTRAVELAYKKK